MSNPTHRHNKRPQLSLRYLADYMAGSKRNERTVLRANKYPPLARLLQHDDAKSIVSKFIRDGDTDVSWLQEEAARLRDRLADDEFGQRENLVNAGYIERFAEVSPLIQWPAKVTILPPGLAQRILVNGVKITLGFNVRLRRTTKTNKIKHGSATLRYSKGHDLPIETAAWQSAFIYGFLVENDLDDNVVADKALCLTLDAWAGKAYSAPSDSVSRYKDMAAACSSIAEQWANISAPPKAILDE
jgi:hypothetical protein